MNSKIFEHIHEHIHEHTHTHTKHRKNLPVQNNFHAVPHPEGYINGNMGDPLKHVVPLIMAPLILGPFQTIVLVIALKVVDPHTKIFKLLHTPAKINRAIKTLLFVQGKSREKKGKSRENLS